MRPGCRDVMTKSWPVEVWDDPAPLDPGGRPLFFLREIGGRNATPPATSGVLTQVKARQPSPLKSSARPTGCPADRTFPAKATGSGTREVQGHA
jgi:hypothetical protein